LIRSDRINHSSIFFTKRGPVQTRGQPPSQS